MIRAIKVHAGATNDRSIWRQSEIKNYMCYLRSDEEILRNEGEYYIIGKILHHITFLYK